MEKKICECVSVSVANAAKRAGNHLSEFTQCGQNPLEIVFYYNFKKQYLYLLQKREKGIINIKCKMTDFFYCLLKYTFPILTSRNVFGFVKSILRK